MLGNSPCPPHVKISAGGIVSAEDRHTVHKLNGFSTSALTLTLFAASSATAAQLQLTYNGVFNSQDALNLASQSTPTFFTSPTPFTIKARFDTSSTNLAPSFGGPFDGFRAYEPSMATLIIGSSTYSFDTSLATGITVAIFDSNSFTPGRYGIGILVDPVNDGAGIIGDFTGASPGFSASSITPTVFTGYYGVGYGSGVCTVGTGGNCTVNAVSPIRLTNSSNQLYSLTLGNYDEDYPVVHDPNNPAAVGPLNSASLSSVPEPATWSLAGAGFLALAGFARRRRS